MHPASSDSGQRLPFGPATPGSMADMWAATAHLPRDSWALAGAGRGRCGVTVITFTFRELSHHAGLAHSCMHLRIALDGGDRRHEAVRPSLDGCHQVCGSFLSWGQGLFSPPASLLGSWYAGWRSLVQVTAAA